MEQISNNKNLYSDMIAHYKFEDSEIVGKDNSGNNNDAILLGTCSPKIEFIGGKTAVSLTGGPHGSSYLQLPNDLLKNVSDETGLTVSTWVYFAKGTSVWERLFDFGKGAHGPYLFLTRNLRGVCFAGSDLAVDPGKSYSNGEWLHITMTVVGTKGGTLSSAGPILYVNGEIVSDGSISQTSSGTYAKLRTFFKEFSEASKNGQNYIGSSQYDVDANFAGSFSDFRIYKTALTEDQVIDIMCESLTDEEILNLAKEKYLTFNTEIVTEDINFSNSLMGNKVSVAWRSDKPNIIDNKGVVKSTDQPDGVTLTAVLSKGNISVEKSFRVSVIPKHIPPYTLTINGDDEGVDISNTLYGLFYEDINNAADGGIYAELIQNRSFESFVFDTYDHKSGEDGKSTGRNHTPLHGWTGALHQVTVMNTGGLNEHFGLNDPDTNSYYITVKKGATIYNRGFSDSNQNLAMAIKDGASYDFSIWAKAKKEATITLQLQDGSNNPISNAVTIEIQGNTWHKYGIDETIVLTGNTTAMGQLSLHFDEEVSIDMVSLMPRDVWGALEEDSSTSAHTNYLGNPNYRLRKDLVQTLIELHPTFLRFPGGCISEGSYIWENVYDWKESVGDIELRKENFNVWGYMMTMGLGYMEYFQLAEDLNATPLPVMACGVLCQARSDYANPAGGSLRDMYIKNFTDLIDFAISTDFDKNEWAKLRKHMGHKAPFDLHYLGVGNENWGTEFFANFEIFKVAIDEYMNNNYPGYELTIISTVGAQADDIAFQEGWKFLSGNYKGSTNIRFTDGISSTEETVSWYQNQSDYMETIADEHYYRSNLYLLNNVDRYNYYDRAYLADGSMDESKTSKVFVGEYASTDKNTLAGAVAEAAIMTGFENNSDVVRLAATAPLFNKVLTDGTYRWTPDCIWFDDESVWRTPNYFVQQLFAKYLGTKVIKTSFETFKNGNPMRLTPHGGIEIATGNAELLIKEVTVVSNNTGEILFHQDFRRNLDPLWHIIPGSSGYTINSIDGLLLKATESGRNGFYLYNEEWSNYTVNVIATKKAGKDGFIIGAGLTEIEPTKKDVIEYVIGLDHTTTGVKVYKKGLEGYVLGDYSSGIVAGNLRAANYEPLQENTEYTITLNYGGNTGEHLICSYTDGNTLSKELNYKLEAYNDLIFHSVTKDTKHVYIKLVNADPFNKTTRIQLQNLDVSSIGKRITLTTDPDLVHVPNVNGKNDEKVTPAEEVLSLTSNSISMELTSNSVTILILDLA
jgi:alpha-L-arabinofuranosidase